MSINLQKDQTVSLTKEVPGLSKVRIGLGWDTNIDLDASCFGLSVASGSPKLVSDDYFVFFNNLRSADGAIRHSGDNRTGDVAGDDETITVDLTAVNKDVTEIAVFVTIYNQPGKTFSMVKDAYIHIVNDANGSEIARYDLTTQFTNENCLQFGSLFYDGKEWQFKALGAGYVAELGDVVAQYK